MPTTNARVREAFEEYRVIRVLSEDPAAGNLEGGEMWFNTTDSAWRGYDGSSYVSFDVTADA
ncbi:hypothetical protein [Natronorubrum sp. FCH18a]|uniref:hypothetical protein n=1 Tax=Natronorubrum sp. FCH18a TaxID=3447018 RepID=UPI003F516253